MATDVNADIQKRLDALDRWRQDRLAKARRRYDAEIKCIQTDYEQRLSNVAHKLISISPKRRHKPSKGDK